jgi:YfiR/HmsC-like
MRHLTTFGRLKPRLIVLILAIGLGLNASIASTATSEQALTVAFLYNFLKFTEWPEGTITDGLSLCVTDSAVFGEELDAIAGRLAQNKTVNIKHIELGENTRECQLLFLPREEKPVRIREWLKNTDSTRTLTVSNMGEFLDMGGMIVLIDDSNRLQFEVNLERVKSSGLKLSAQLLKIARDVRGK